MHQVDDGDLGAIDGGPEGVIGVGVVDEDVFRAQNSNWCTFHQQQLSFVRMSRELAAVHSQPVVSSVIVDAEYEKNHLLGLVGGLCKVESNFEVL